jgi:V-type H+-transporting ATPase subunit d
VITPQTATDYGGYLANEASPLYTSTIVDRCTQKLVDDWNAMRCQVRAGT